MQIKSKLSELVVQVEEFDKKGDFIGLLKAANNLLAKDPNNSVYILYKLKALDGLGKVSLDLKLVQHYVNMRSSDVTGFLLLYKVYMAMNNVAESLMSLIYALSIEPDNKEIMQFYINLLADIDPKFTSVKINIMTTNRIGHLAMEIEPLLRRHQNEDSCLYIFISNPVDVANSYLYALLKSCVDIVESPFWFNLYVTRPLLLDDFFFAEFSYDVKLSLRGLSSRQINERGFQNLINTYQEFPVCIEIPKEDLDFGWQLLEPLGIREKDKIVCLHVRDSAYLSKQFPEKNFTYHDYRDAKIDSYQIAVEHLLSTGYKVIRLGSSSNQSLLIDNDNFIDLCINRDEEYGDFLDIFLLSTCDYFIANFSGPFCVAAMFDTPILVINGTPVQHPHSKYGRYIPKRLFQNKEEINLMEVCHGKTFSEDSEDTILFHSHLNLKEHGYYYLDNSPADILSAVKEFDNLVVERVINEEPTSFQKNYISELPADFCHRNTPNVVCDSFISQYPHLFSLKK